MSSSNPSDPRLLLPDWLRDGDTPLPTPTKAKSAEQPVAVVENIEVVEAVPVGVAVQVAVPAMPFSERLSLDTRLDPGALVSADDLPAWLGGLEHHTTSVAAVMASSHVTAQAVPATVTIEEPPPYEGVDAPEDGVIDVQVNGWYMIAGAIGLLILLAAALRLYLS